MRKKANLIRGTALMMVAVMLLPFLIFDRSFRTKAEEVSELIITAKLEETDYAVDLSDTGGCIYVNEKALNVEDDVSVKVRLEITGVDDDDGNLQDSGKATDTDTGTVKVTYVYTAENDESGGTTQSGETGGNSGENTVTKDDNGDYYVTLEGAGTYEFKVTYGENVATISKKVKYEIEDFPAVVSDSVSVNIDTASNSGNKSYTSLSEYNGDVVTYNIWCKNINSLNMIIKEEKTFISSATVTCSEYQEMSIATVAADDKNVIFEKENINVETYNFSEALSKINTLSDGRYVITFKTVSWLGAEKSVDLYVWIDRTEPEISIKSSADNMSYTEIENTADEYIISAMDGETVIVSVEDSYSGIKETSVTVDGKIVDIVKENTGENIYEYIFSESGTYNLEVSATDNAGNDSNRNLTVIVDNVIPEITIKNITIDGEDKTVSEDNFKETLLYLNGNSTTVTFEVSGYGITATDDVAYKVSVDDSDITDSFPPDNVKIIESTTDDINTIMYIFTLTEDGRYSFDFNASGHYATINSAEKEFNYIVYDTENPVAGTEGIPENGLSAGTEVNIIITDNETLDADNFTLTGYWKYYDESEYNKVNMPVKSVDKTTLKASMYCGEKDGKACSYYFTVTGYDRAGNTVKYTVGDSNLKVDATAPAVTISPLPEETNDGYYNSSVSFTISVTEQYSNTTTIKVSDANKAINGDEDETYYLKDTEGTFTIKRSSQGIYKLNITVTDAFGNETVKTVNFVIDKTKPEIEIGTVSKLNNGNVSLKINVSDNYKGKSYRVHVVRKNSSGVVVYNGDYLNEEWNSKSVSPILSFTDEGDYTVTVYSTDKAGNEAEIDSAIFRIDKTAPVLSITGVNDTQITDCTATFSINEAFAFNFDGSSLSSNDISVTITKKTDGSAETTVATLNASNFSSGNPHMASYFFNEDGEYTITFTAKDLAGNTATVVTKTFKVDKTAPEILVSAVNSSNAEISSYDVVGGNDELKVDYVSMKITVNETFFASNNVTIKVTKDGVDVSKEYFANFNSNTESGTGFQIFLEDGVYTVDITAVDALGNAAKVYNLVFTIDNTAPVIEATGKLTDFMSRMTDDGDLLLNSGDFADILNMGYEALWEVNDTSVFNVVVKLDGVDFVDFSDLTDGYHTITITVTDEAGHITGQEFGFTYDGTAPRIIITGVESGSVVTESFIMTVSLEDKDDFITGIFINGEKIDPSLYEETNIYEYRVNEYGDYEIVVYAEDNAGNKASTNDSETGKVFSFSYRQQISIVFIIIIIIIAILLILLIILFIRIHKKKNK